MIDNNSLFFLRHGKLALPYVDHSLIPLEVLADLASGRQNPPADEEFNLKLIKKLSTKIPFTEVVTIYCSPSKRCQDSAIQLADFLISQFSLKPKAKVLDRLKEISFDLLKIYHPNQTGKVGIEALNHAVLESIVMGKNIEFLEDIKKRIANVFLEITREKSGVKIVISHDFLMRFIEIYIRNRGHFPPNLATKDLLETQRNLYLSGFSTDYSLTNFDKV